MMGRIRQTLGATVVGPALLASILVACATERSVEAFCDTYQEETTRLADKYNQRAALAEGEGGLIGLGVAFGSLVEAQGDMVVLFDRLEQRAPDEIAPDVAAVRDALRAQADAMASGDLVTMFFGGTVTALQAGGSASRVDSYLEQNCAVPQ